MYMCICVYVYKCMYIYIYMHIQMYDGISTLIYPGIILR